MADTPYKIVDLVGVASMPPSTVGLAPGTVMQYEPFRAVAEAQDGVAAGCRRIVAVRCMSGAQSFHVPANGAPGVDLGSHGDYPDRDRWRDGGTIWAPRVFPGNVLRARIYYVGSGQTQYEDPPSTWNPGGPFGAIRLRHTWTAADGTTDGPIDEDLELPASEIEDAAEPAGGAALWQALTFLEVELRPTALDDEDVAVLWAENVAAQVEVHLRGAPRIVAVVVHEQPLRVVYAHDNEDARAVNGQTGVEAPQTLFPQTKDTDGATYQEQRFGTGQLVGTARRQSELGPWVCNLLAWDEGSQAFFEDIDPISVTSSTFVDILDQSSSSYDRDRPGFIVAAAHAQQHHLCDAGLVLGGEAAVVPVRIRIEAYLTGDANLATIRVQSGEFEWIDIDIDGVVPTTYEATGYLECQVTPDHAWATVQVFARVDADAVEILSVAPIFGD